MEAAMSLLNRRLRQEPRKAMGASHLPEIQAQLDKKPALLEATKLEVTTQLQSSLKEKNI